MYRCSSSLRRTPAATPRFGTHFTCFTGTKVQILTRVWEDAATPRFGTHFPCFTGTKVQTNTDAKGDARLLLSSLRPHTPEEALEYGMSAGTHFTCFTSTKVPILALRKRLNTARGAAAGTQFTCFTSTKVQILTQPLSKR